MAVVVSGCQAVLPPPDGGVPSSPDVTVPFLELNLQPRPGDPSAVGERPTGPVIEVARGNVGGTPFSLTAFSARLGVCTWMERESMGGGGGCGAVPGAGPMGGPHFGMVGESGEGGFSGLVSPEVAAVVVETDAGVVQPVIVSLEPADIEAQLFFAFLPTGAEVTRVVALDATENEIGRTDFAADPEAVP